MLCVCRREEEEMNKEIERHRNKLLKEREKRNEEEAKELCWKGWKLRMMMGNPMSKEELKEKGIVLRDNPDGSVSWTFK